MTLWFLFQRRRRNGDLGLICGVPTEYLIWAAAIAGAAIVLKLTGLA